MKQKMVSILLILVLVTGCQKNVLNVYREASVKTDEIKRGSSDTELELAIEFKEDLPSSWKDLVGNIYFKTTTLFNKDTEEIISHQFISNKDYGIDTVYYQNKDIRVIELPSEGKYIDLKGINSSEEVGFNKDTSFISDESIKKILKIWLDILENKDVMYLGKTVVDTPEGEVKVKEIVVNITGDQLKSFLNETLIILSQDEKFRKTLTKYLENKFKEEGVFDFDEMVEVYRALIEKVEVDLFTATTYIDIDGYMVDNSYKIQLSFQEDEAMYVKSMTFDGHFITYDIGQKHAFIFPDMEGKSITTDELLEKYKIKLETKEE